MSKPTTNAVAVAEPSLDFVAQAVQTFEGIDRLATLMSKMGTMPQHLAGKPADCFRIVVQAAKWRMDPFAVAECTCLVHGRMCYEGKLVAAVLASRGVRLRHVIEGKGQEARITLTGTPPGEDRECSLSGSVREWRTTGNGSPWDKQPEIQLVYRGTRQWARIFAPDVMLGVYTPDELDEIREVQATVIATAEPARVAQPEPVQTDAAAPAVQDSSPATSDTSPAAPETKPDPAKSEPPKSEHIAAGKALFADWCKEDAGQAKALAQRLSRLHGADFAKDIPADRRGKYVQDCANLKGRALADAADLIASWEDIAKATPQAG